MKKSSCLSGACFAALISTSLPSFAASPVSAKPGESFTDCQGCAEMVVIPAGKALLGTGEEEAVREKLPPGEARAEGPQYPVMIAKPFAIGRYEVTLAQYRVFATESGRPDGDGCMTYDMTPGAGFKLRKDPQASWRDLKSTSFKQNETYPVVCVTWTDAQAFAEWMSKRTGAKYRLPSQTEWEYAARGGTTTARYWGDGREKTCKNANVADYNGSGRFSWAHDPEVHFMCLDSARIGYDVGGYTPNPFGLFDVLGNVWEWTQDCMTPTTQAIPRRGKAAGGKSCAQRVIRGGSFAPYPRQVRSGARLPADPAERSFLIGFRLVRDL